MSEPLSIGTTTTATITHKCLVCHKELPLGILGLIAHDDCLTCPKCGAGFTVWQKANKDGRAVLRCLDCLHRWEGSDA